MAVQTPLVLLRVQAFDPSETLRCHHVETLRAEPNAMPHSTVLRPQTAYEILNGPRVLWKPSDPEPKNSRKDLATLGSDAYVVKSVTHSLLSPYGGNGFEQRPPALHSTAPQFRAAAPLAPGYSAAARGPVKTKAGFKWEADNIWNSKGSVLWFKESDVTSPTLSAAPLAVIRSS